MSEDSAQLNSLLKDARLPDHQEVLMVVMVMVMVVMVVVMVMVMVVVMPGCQITRRSGSNGGARLSTTSCFESQMGV